MLVLREQRRVKRWMFHRAEGWDADAKTRNLTSSEQLVLNG